MRVDVLIPTYNRPALLRKCLLSLERSTHPVCAVVLVDGNPNYDQEFIFGKIPIVLEVTKTRRDWIGVLNAYLKRDQAIGNPAPVLYASDDLEFEPDCVKLAVTALEERFPDGDGLIGINQGIPGGQQSAFGLMGRKFIGRFPNGAVFCPDYVHWWSDSELGEYARSIGKFHWCKEARVKHNRPHDETWKLAHVPLHDDHVIHRQREAQGLLWGKNFRLLSIEGE